MKVVPIHHDWCPYKKRDIGTEKHGRVFVVMEAGRKVSVYTPGNTPGTRGWLGAARGWTRPEGASPELSEGALWTPWTPSPERREGGLLL